MRFDFPYGIERNTVNRAVSSEWLEEQSPKVNSRLKYKIE